MRSLAQIFRRLLAAAPLVCTAAVAVACSGGTTSTSDASTPFPPCPTTDQTQIRTSACSLATAQDGGTSDDGGDAASTDAAPTDASVEAAACTCTVTCAQSMSKVTSCRFLYPDASDDAGTLMVECVGVPYCLGGRRPDGLEPYTAHAFDGHAAFFLASAHLEAASVDAFQILADELEGHGAPFELAQAARDAARDEVAHAEAMAALAGAEVPAVRVIRGAAPRSVEQIALENAREGCVRETFAALLAHRQATCAADPRVRDVMRVIAEDETRHATLSWRIAEVLDARLSPAARARVAEARREAIEALRGECAAGAEDPALGLPGSSEALALLDGLNGSLWAAVDADS